MTPEWWYLISDLHLRPDGLDERGITSALAGFAQHVVQAERPHSHLVLLGDSFELTSTPGAPAAARAAEAIARLDEIALAFAPVFDAWRELIAAGHHLHVVCGNHDAELALPAVTAHLAQLLRPSPGLPGRIHLHPWLLHRPGLLYAEHGHQHHALNRSPTMLTLARPVEGAPTPPWPPLATLGALRARDAGPLLLTGRVLGSVADSWRAERAARHAAYQRLIVEVACLEQLPVGTVRAIHHGSAFHPGRACTGTAWRVLARRLGGKRHDQYLHAAAARIDRIMQADLQRPVCYAFGHSHVAALVPLPGTSAFYANTGTWSPLVRGGQVPGFPVLSVWTDTLGRHAQLTRWPA